MRDLAKVRHAAVHLDEAPEIELPLVSVVITNFNYGRFLEEAVRSVADQTYPHIETIIVDDCSTDDSATVIEGLGREDPLIVAHFNSTNSGQGASCRNGYRLSRGAYVIFLDADDYLLPTCVETHILAHLSLRMPVGLTSVDMIQMADGRAVTITSQGFSEYVVSGRGAGVAPHRRDAFADGDPTASLNDKLHFVQPKDANLWPWSPTSGNCFRRDALELIIHCDRLGQVRGCADIYFIRGVAVLSGSVLIDKPLAVYRLHGENDFVKGATLYRMRIFDTSYLQRHSDVAMTALIDHLFEHVEPIFDRIESPFYLQEVFETLGNCWPPIRRGTSGLDYLATKIIDNRAVLTRLFGREIVFDWLVARILPRSRRRGRRRPLRAVWRMVAAIPVFAFVALVAIRRRAASPNTAPSTARAP